MIEWLLLFVVIAIFAEAIYENLKMIFPQNPPTWVDRLGVMFLAVFFCIATGADLFEVFGVYLPWSSGAFFSGILCSRGANYLHDIVGKLGGK